MIMQAGLPRSLVIQRRPSFSATAAVVPEPPLKAATRLFSLVAMLITLSSNRSGFFVA